MNIVQFVSPRGLKLDIDLEGLSVGFIGPNAGISIMPYLVESVILLTVIIYFSPIGN
jgi:hypothetical protein